MTSGIHNTATFVRDVSHAGAVQHLYRLDPPMRVDNYAGKRDVPFVVVSAVLAPFSGPETYVFEATADGDITEWGELEGSYRGDLDHARALRNAGYEVSHE